LWVIALLPYVCNANSLLQKNRHPQLNGDE